MNSLSIDIFVFQYKCSVYFVWLYLFTCISTLCGLCIAKTYIFTRQIVKASVAGT